MKQYGVGYKGGKSKLVDSISKAIPYAEVFVDLFAGGCAMTHWAMETKRFKRFVANDMQGDGLRLFAAGIEGKYRNETRWISRDDFFKLKDSEPYVSLCWSYGNDQSSYMYAKEIEPWKKALHYARVFGDFSLLKEFGIDSDGSRADIVKHMDEYKRKYIRWWLSKQGYSAEELDALIARCKGQIEVHEEELRQYLLRGLESSGLTQAEVGQRLGTQMTGHYFGRSQWSFPTQEYYEMMQAFMPALDKDYNDVIGLHNLWQRLQRLQSLQSLQRLQRLETSFVDYRAVAIPRHSVVYCDPPYFQTSGYIVNGNQKDGSGFDHQAFYDWCESQTELVLISEYFMPSDRFTTVWSKDHTSSYGHSGTKTTECLFVPTRQLAMYKAMMDASYSRQLLINF